MTVWQKPPQYYTVIKLQLKKKKEISTVGKFTGTGSRSEAPGVVGGGSRGGGMDGLGRSRVMHNGYKTSVCSDIKVVEMVEKYYPCN